MNTNPPEQLSFSAKSGIRLLIAFEISLVLHLAIIFGIQVGEVARNITPRAAIEARIMAMPPAQALPTHILVKAIDRQMPSQVADYRPVAHAAAGKPTENTAPGSGMSPTLASPTLVNAPLPVDPTYYSGPDVDDLPSIINDVQPKYPEKAAAENIRGDVKVLFLLNETGTVDEVSVLEQHPPGYDLDRAVIDWLQQAKFKPAMRHGRAVKMRVVYRVTFEP